MARIKSVSEISPRHDDGNPGFPVEGRNRESEASGLPARLKRCAELAGNGDALAQKAAVPRRTLETYLSGRAEPKASRLVAIAGAVDVSLDWLLTGEGPMERGGDHAYTPREQGAAARPGVAEAAETVGLDHLDEDTLVAAVVAVEEVMAEEGWELDPRTKGQIVGLLYDMYIDRHGAGAAAPAIDKRNVTRLFKLVS